MISTSYLSTFRRYDVISMYLTFRAHRFNFLAYFNLTMMLIEARRLLVRLVRVFGSLLNVLGRFNQLA